MVVPRYEGSPERGTNADGYKDCADEASLEVVGVAEDVIETLEEPEDHDVLKN